MKLSPNAAATTRAARRLLPNEFTVSRIIRGVIGALVPLFISLQLGHLKQGLWVFMGVLLLLQGERAIPYLARIRYSLATAGIGLIGFAIGAIVPGSGKSPVRDLILVLSMGLVSFCAGYMSGFSQAWCSGTLTLLMLASTSMDNDAVSSQMNAALWFLAGVALYEVMVLIEWLLLRDLPERQALSSSYGALGRYALAVQKATAAGPTSPLAPLPISPTIADPVTEARREVYQTCVEGRKNTKASPWHAEAERILTHIGNQTAKLTAARFLPRSLSGVDVGGISARAQAGDARICDPRQAPQPAERTPSTSAHWRDFVRYITHPSHDAVMQGVRLALCMMTAVVVHRFVGTPHSYWIVVAVAMIAKPDYGSVYSRAIQRSIGAVGGVGIGWAIFQFIPKGWGQAVAIMVLMALLPLVKRWGYTAQAVVFTPLMLVFTNLILPGGTSVDYGPERLAATAIGAAIVIIMGYAIWPRSREGRIIPLAREGRVRVSAMLEGEKNGEDPGPLRSAARKAEAALRGQLARSLTEPSAVATQAAMWTPTAATLERLVDLATAAEVLTQGPAVSASLARAAEAAKPTETRNPVPHNRPVEPLPPAATEPEAELLRAIVVLASSLDTLTPPPDQVESALQASLKIT